MLILTAMAAGLSFSQGQVEDYTLAWAEGTPFLAAPEDATVVATGSDDAIYTITDRYDEVYNYDVTCYVYGQTASEVTATYNGSSYSHDISGNTDIKGIALPFDFYYNGKTMKYVLPMADGRIALSEQEDMSDMAKPYVTIFNMNETGLDAVMFEVYAYDDNFQQAIGNRVLKSGGSVKYWTTEDDVFVVEYKDVEINNSYIADESKKIALTLSWQVQFKQDGSVIFAIDGIEDADFTNVSTDNFPFSATNTAFMAAFPFFESGTVQRVTHVYYNQYRPHKYFLNGTNLQYWVKGSGVETDNVEADPLFALYGELPDYQIYDLRKDGFYLFPGYMSSTSIGVAVTAPSAPAECAAPAGTFEFAQQELLSSSTPTGCYYKAYPGEQWGTADDFLFVLDNDGTLSFTPQDGLTYNATSEIGNGEVVLTYDNFYWPNNSSGEPYFYFNMATQGSTEYTVYCFPYNDCRQDGLKYASAIEVGKFNSPEGAPEINSLTYTEDALELTFDDAMQGKRVLVLYTDAPFDWNGAFGAYGEYRPDGGSASFNPDAQAGDSYMEVDGIQIRYAYYGTLDGSSIRIEGLTPNRVYSAIAYTVTGSDDALVFTADCAHASVYVPATEVPISFGPYPATNLNESGEGTYLISYDQQWPDAGWGNQPEGVDMSQYLSRFDMIFGWRTHYERFIQMSVPANGTVSFTTPAFTTSRVALTVSMELARAASSNAAEDFQSGDSFLLEYAQPETDAVDTTWNTAETLTSLASLAEGSIDGLYWWDVNIDGIDPEKPVLLRVSATSGGAYSYYMLVRRVNVNERAACPLPSVSVVDVTDAQALATWTKTVDEADTNSGYIFSYGPQGGAFSEPVLVSDTSFLMESLLASTTYTVNVRALCGEGDTSNVSERNFTTLRGLPYTMLAAQETNPIAGSNVYASQNGVYDQSGSGWSVFPMYMENIGSVRALTIQAIQSDLTDSVLVALPEFYKESTGERQEFVTFKVGVGTASSSNPMPSTMDSILAETSKLQVLLSTDGVFENADVIGEISGSELVYGSYLPFTFPIQTENEGLCRIGFAWMNTEADKTIQTDYTYILLDSVYVKSVVSPCDEISGPLGINQADAVTATTATIVLPESEALSYMFRYGVLDFSGNQQWDTIFTDSRVIELEGLAPATAYTSDVYQAIDLAGRYVCMKHVDFIDFATLVSCYPVDTFALMAATRNNATFQVLDPATDSAAKVLRVFTEDASFDRAYAWPENTLYYTVSGLTAGTDYMALVRVVCAEGDSSVWSADTVRFSTEAEPQPVCEVPTGLQAVPGIDNASLSWTAGEGNESFEVLYRETSASEFDTLECQAAEYDLTGLTAETSYSWTVIGVCGDLRSEAAEVASFTTASESEPERCGVPTALASVPGVDNASLSWTAGEGNDSFEVLYRETSASEFDTLDCAEASYNLTGLTAETSYSWTVIGVCGDLRSEAAEVASFTTASEPEPERCGVPTALASVPGIDTVALSWTAGENNVSFEVIYKEASAAQYDTVQSEEASCVVRGLTKKTAYVWSVRGICEEISSDFAEEAEFETLDETANENSLAAALRVLSQDDMIHILNPAKIRIDRVQVYTTTGARVADLTVRADNNVSIPVDGGRILLVNVFSGSENAIFKVYVR